jgi:arylsulfatase A-like enzyme
MPRCSRTVSHLRVTALHNSSARFVRTSSLLFPLLIGAACGSPDRLPPNLILLSSEIEASELACLDGAAGEGQALCELARAGARCSWRSRHTSTAAFVGTLMTSRPASEHGLGGSAAAFLSSDALTVAEALRQAGFRTAAVVTAAELNRSSNFQQGFDAFIDRPAVPNARGLDSEAARVATDAALQWARDAPPPWFLWVHYRAELTAVDREVSHLVRGLDDLGVDPGVLFTGTGARIDRRAATARLDARNPAIPLLWRSPDKRPIAAGPGDCTFETADLAATLLTAAGQPIPDGFRGKPLFFADWRRGERRLLTPDPQGS